MTKIDPQILDREIARAAAALRRERSALRHRFEEALDPLARERRVSSKTTYLELAERAADPIASASRDWVGVLTIARVTWADEVRVARAWQAESIEREDLDPKRSSPAFALARVLGEVVVARRHLWADALASRGVVELADAGWILEERRAEAARRLGAEDPERLELPADPKSAIAVAAEAFLRETDGLVAGAERWDDTLASMLARDAGEGWPSRLTPRWLASIFAGTGLFDGLSLDVGELPLLLGAASFARAFTALGAAYAEADVPTSAPFVLARPPFDLRRARRAALFGALPADPVFGVRALGIGRVSAKEQARRCGSALVSSLRLSAAKVLLRGAVSSAHGPRGEHFEELTSRALGAPIPGALAGVVPRLGAEDATTFAGALLAARDRKDLVERSDEDWFRSPHAALLLRQEQGALPESPMTTGEALTSALSLLLADLTRILS